MEYKFGICSFCFEFFRQDVKYSYLKSIYSLTFSFNSKNFSEDDFASALRKKQSASWALKWYEEYISTIAFSGLKG